MQVDHEPRVEANWFCGGLNPFRLLRLKREGLDSSDENVMKKISYPFQVSSKTIREGNRHVFMK